MAQFDLKKNKITTIIVTWNRKEKNVFLLVVCLFNFDVIKILEILS